MHFLKPDYSNSSKPHQHSSMYCYPNASRAQGVFTCSVVWGTVIGQAAVQGEQQQKNRRFGCREHHDPELGAEPQNRIQQSPQWLLFFCLRVSNSVCTQCLCVWAYLLEGLLGVEHRGQSIKRSDENPRLVYLESVCTTTKDNWVTLVCFCRHAVVFVLLGWFILLANRTKGRQNV